MGYQVEFENLFKRIYDLADCSLEDYFNDVQIQHVPRYSYGEDIATLVEASQDRLSLPKSYKIFTKKIVDLKAPWINPNDLAIGESYHQEGKVRWDQGDYVEARKLLEKSLDERRRQGTLKES